MADDPIPADLIALQSEFTAARAAVRRAAQTGKDMEPLMAEERRLALALHDLREGTPWKPWEQQKRVRAAAAGGGGE